MTASPRSESKWALLLYVTLPLLVLDQVTKWAILKNFSLHEFRPVIPGFFDLLLVYNTGAAFGMFSNNNAFFIGLSLFATVLILGLWACGSFVLPLTRWAVAILLAGVVGNFVDRIQHGAVVDFLGFTLPIYGPWPAFNVADSCICIAAFLLLIQSFWDMATTKKKTPSDTTK